MLKYLLLTTDINTIIVFFVIPCACKQNWKEQIRYQYTYLVISMCN